MIRSPSLSLVDAHAHMNDEAFGQDLEDVLDRATSRGVCAVLAVSETLSDALEILNLAERYPLIKPCAGLYPTFLDPDAAAQMFDFIRKNEDRLACIGEVGLDYWIVKDQSEREIQRHILAQHVALSLKLDLPLNVHSRSAGRHAIAFLRENRAERVLLHAFDGKASAAKDALEAGYYFSIPPSVVRSQQKQKLVRHLPLERMLLESDAPVLGPEKDRRNEPVNVWIACEYIARAKGIPVDEVARATTENARRLFPRAFS